MLAREEEPAGMESGVEAHGLSWVVFYQDRAEQELHQGSYEEAMRSGTERHPALCAAPARRYQGVGVGFNHSTFRVTVRARPSHFHGRRA